MATTGESIIGHEAALYYNSGTRATPALVLISRAMDVEVALGSNTGTFASRVSNFQSQKVALLITGLNFGYEYVFGSAAGVHSDAVFERLKNHYFAKSIQEYYALDGPDASGNEAGIRFFGQVSEMNETQPLEDAVVFDFVIVPVRHLESSTLQEPEWYP